MTCPKGKKRQLSLCIVNAIKSQDPPGRFLELDSRLDSWIVVDKERAIEKTCQTLRKGRGNICSKISPLTSENNIH